MNSTFQFEWRDVLDIGPECDERFLDWQKVPELEALDIQLCGVSHLAGRYSVGRTDPIAHTVLYSVDGCVELFTREGQQTVEKGMVIILPAHEPFLIELHGSTWSMCWFDFADGPRWRDAFKSRRSLEVCEGGRRIFHAVSLIYYEKDKELRQPMVRYLERYLNQTMNANDLVSPELQRLRQLFRDVEKRLHYPWSVEEMCELIHYSPPHLHRLCRKHFGRSPLQQVIHMRMERAKHFLSSTTWPIEQVSEQVGYHDIFSFSKRFKKSVGVSPAKYRSEGVSIKPA